MIPWIVDALQSTTLFRNFPYDQDIREPYFVWDIPCVGGTVGVIPLDFGFWVSTFVLLGVQTLINCAIACVTYQYVVQASSSTVRHLVGFGILVPLLLVTPLLIYPWIGLENVALMLCLCGAVPIILTLRVVEATCDMLPDYARHSQAMLLLYYSAPLQLKFDPHTKRPVPFTRRIFWKKLSAFALVFVQTSLLYSLLIPCGYILVSNTTAPPTQQQQQQQQQPVLLLLTNIIELFYWGNLANAFLMASLMSLVLDGGCSGLGLLMSICTGYTLEQFSDSPLTQSSSPSDFWGRRWDRPVQSTLRRGCFRPLRASGYSRTVAAAATFVVSGAIHEYILWLMSLRQGSPNNPHGLPYQPAVGNQFFFFVWNGVVLLLERGLIFKTGHHPAWIWIHTHVPKPMRTALVLLTVLPIAHLFTDEYVRFCFFGDAAWGFPILTYQPPPPPL